MLLLMAILLFAQMGCMVESQDILEAEVDHSYSRPKKSEVSGFPGFNAKYYRSPCPGLNALANHGYLPRDGKNITPDLVRQAIVQVFNADVFLATILAQALPDQFTLADLSIHGFIEHDASLVHDDSVWRNDPSQVNTTLVQKLLDKSKKRYLGPKQLASFRNSREKECAKTNRAFTFGITEQTLAYFEAAAFLVGMGDSKTHKISVAHAKSFLQDERIPNDWKRSAKPITLTDLIQVATEMKMMYAIRNVAADF